MEKRFSSLEQKIISYLCNYGNTKESDLIVYGVQRLGISEEDMLELIEVMVFNGRIKRILHTELKPAVTYVKQGRLVPFEFELLATSYSIEYIEATDQQIENIKEIIESAEAIAKKRMKRETKAID
jgi:hypothetical protein